MLNCCRNILKGKFENVFKLDVLNIFTFMTFFRYFIIIKKKKKKLDKNKVHFNVLFSKSYGSQT